MSALLKMNDFMEFAKGDFDFKTNSISQALLYGWRMGWSACRCETMEEKPPAKDEEGQSLRTTSASPKLPTAGAFILAATEFNIKGSAASKLYRWLATSGEPGAR
jgi:hypothetical protein